MLEHTWDDPPTGTALVVTGCAPQVVDHLEEAADARPRLMGQGWVSDVLLADTMAVWSKTYGRPVGKEEAMEILTNIKHYAEVLLKAAREADLP